MLLSATWRTKIATWYTREVGTMVRPTDAPAPRYLLDVRKRLETARWGNAPSCYTCEQAGRESTWVMPMSAPSVRSGVYRCTKCGSRFTVTTNTFMQGSHIGLNKWWYAFGLVRDGESARTISEELRVSYKTARRLKSVIERAIGGGQLIIAAKKYVVKPKRTRRS